MGTKSGCLSGPFLGIEKQEPSLFPYPSNPDKRGPHPAEGTLWHLVAVRNRGLLRLTVNLLSHALPTVLEDAAAGSGDFLNFALIVLWKILKIDYAAFAGGLQSGEIPLIVEPHTNSVVAMILSEGNVRNQKTSLVITPPLASQWNFYRLRNDALAGLIFRR